MKWYFDVHHKDTGELVMKRLPAAFIDGADLGKAEEHVKLVNSLSPVYTCKLYSEDDRVQRQFDLERLV